MRRRETPLLWVTCPGFEKKEEKRDLEALEVKVVKTQYLLVILSRLFLTKKRVVQKEYL